MKTISIIASSAFQVLSIFFVLGYLLGLLNLHFSDKNDYCVMTYMFEYPQFVRLSLPESDLYPQYGLYAYSEGRFTERARRMWFDGVPVLFIPGNSGSHMQARSIASVALRKALSNGNEFHFDFFTISYNEELSGLYGGVLQSQTKFAIASINKILSLYKANKYTKTMPTSVILIGHSMGGLIAKRLLSYPTTIGLTNIAITLATPLEAPIINFDIAINDYYVNMDLEWETFVNQNKEMKQKKILITFGSGPRDILVPSGLTSSKDSYINALTTAIPGVWVSPDHVGIVWCKQLVIVINRYLFSIVDPNTHQLVENPQIWKSRAKQYFQANRSMILSNEINRENVTMVADAFWYEDNRRIYQVSRPGIDKTTYLMIRLVKFPQNRFVAVEAVNLEDHDWIFGCNAKYAYNTYRYCKHATSLSELSRWTPAAEDFGKRKLATVHLHSIMEAHPDWTHVIVRVFPTRKPITLNVDINDHASRQIFVNLPSEYSFGKTIIKQETEQDSLYYELILLDFNILHDAYLLYVEPTAGCKAQYHVSAEVHIPWARNHEYFHYFTHLKRSPMKLRLFKSNPNVTGSMNSTEHVKVTLLLDPQCTYTISISLSWYLCLAQFARFYTPELISYIAAIVLLAARRMVLDLHSGAKCPSIHKMLKSDDMMPIYPLLWAKLGTMVFMSVPILSVLFESATWNNLEVQYFMKSLLAVPVYVIALGILNVAVAVLLAVMVLSSQIAHRLLFRMVWRGGSRFSEMAAYYLESFPIVMSVMLFFAAKFSCGAAALVLGAVYYWYKISKMYEEYLEDYFYKLMVKFASRICRIFKSKNTTNESAASPTLKSNSDESNTKENLKSSENKCNTINKPSDDNQPLLDSDIKKDDKDLPEPKKKCPATECVYENIMKEDTDRSMNNLNFHLMMFLMWIVVTVVNIPALLTWARNFKYSTHLKVDTSYNVGIFMSACTAMFWRMDGPSKFLSYSNAVAALIFTMAVFILVLGPLSLTVVSYGVTFMFVVIAIQQVFDRDEYILDYAISDPVSDIEESDTDKDNEESNEPNKPEEKSNDKNADSNEELDSGDAQNDGDIGKENRIYTIFRNLKEKISFNNEEL